MEASHEEDKVEYIPFSALAVPGSGSTTPEQLISSLMDKFQSKDWRKHFEALTELRAINKHRPDIYINQVLAQLLKEVAGQVDNLRSNNSKEALTLINQTVQHNKIGGLSGSDLSLIVSKLFIKSCSEKGFLKNEAREAITALEKAEHPALLVEISQQTQAPNYQISELAVLTLKNSLVKKAVSKQNLASEQFLKLLVRNLHAKRALIEKTSKQILAILEKTYTTEGLTALVNSTNLSQEERDTITLELANIKKAANGTKAKGSLKDFLKQKQQQGTETDKMQVE